MELDIKYKPIVIIALLFVTLGIALGAIGAHGLEGIEQISNKNIESWKTGVLYQLFQGLGLLVLVLFSQFFKVEKVKLSLSIITIGTFLFSFSIYVLVLNNIWQIDWIKYAMIPLTPIGGLLMILGWVVFLGKVIRR
jgi:uncharacterized membrane protein YgdD (TMEM256/DUF423 family)